MVKKNVTFLFAVDGSLLDLERFATPRTRCEVKASCSLVDLGGSHGSTGASRRGRSLSILYRVGFGANRTVGCRCIRALSSVRPGLFSSTVRKGSLFSGGKCSPLEPLCALSARGCLSLRAYHLGSGRLGVPCLPRGQMSRPVILEVNSRWSSIKE